jgi:dihydrolipoamide dehydrogenase
MIEKDIVIIGGGPGGYVAAIHAAHLGANVAVVEKDRLGGNCLNRGCIPTKALVKSVEVLLEARKANEFGIEIGNITANFPKIMARKANVVNKLASGIEQLMKAGNITVYKGVGRILTPQLVKVNDEEIATRKLIIATGSEPIPLPIQGSDLPGVLTTDEVLELKELPESLVVIGGSYVGVEFATIFNGLGTKVTIVEKLPTLLESIDEEISRRFAQTLLRQGIEVRLRTTVKTIKREGAALKVVGDTSEGEQEVTGQMVLMATGRQPYTEGLGLSQLGIKADGRAIVVNERLETSVDGVYAVGDVLGKSMLAHVASYEGEIAADNALGHYCQADYRAVPSCIFTHPEIASVGITEKEAKSSGIPYKVSKFPFLACARAVAMDETAGMVKMVCNAKNGRVLGMHIMGPHASDLIAEGALAIQLEATAKDIAHTIHAHPTLSEAVRETAMGQLEGSIHFQRVPRRLGE